MYTEYLSGGKRWNKNNIVRWKSGSKQGGWGGDIREVLGGGGIRIVLKHFHISFLIII